MEFPIDHVTRIAVEQPPIRSPLAMARHIRKFPMGSWAGVPQATVTHGVSRSPVGEHLSEPEQERLLRALKIALRQVSGRSVPG